MSNPYFKDGKLNRDPHPAPVVKTFVHGTKETIKRVTQPARKG